MLSCRFEPDSRVDEAPKHLLRVALRALFLKDHGAGCAIMGVGSGVRAGRRGYFSCFVMNPIVDQVTLGIYAVLLALGGAVGFLKARSKASLISGLVSA